MKDIDYIKVYKNNEAKAFLKDSEDKHTYHNYKDKTLVDTFKLRVLNVNDKKGYILEEV